MSLKVFQITILKDVLLLNLGYLLSKRRDFFQGKLPWQNFALNFAGMRIKLTCPVNFHASTSLC